MTLSGHQLIVPAGYGSCYHRHRVCLGVFTHTRTAVCVRMRLFIQLHLLFQGWLIAAKRRV